MQAKQELVKEIVPVGNSAGVILPREWLKGKAKIILLEEPLDLKKDIWDIVDRYLEDILGVYLVGSYARGEQTKNSDVDVLVITSKLNKKVKKGKYDVTLISREILEKELESNAIPLLPMLKEAKPLLNRELIKEYKKLSLTKKNVRKIVEITRSALNVINEFVKSKPMELELSYSLILNLRTLYVLDCIKKDKILSTKGLKSLIREFDAMDVYEGYLKEKSGKKAGAVSLEKVEKIYGYLNKKTAELERWLRGRKD